MTIAGMASIPSSLVIQKQPNTRPDNEAHSNISDFFGEKRAKRRNPNAVRSWGVEISSRITRMECGPKFQRRTSRIVIDKKTDLKILLVAYESSQIDEAQTTACASVTGILNSDINARNRG